MKPIRPMIRSHGRRCHRYCRGCETRDVSPALDGRSCLSGGETRTLPGTGTHLITRCLFPQSTTSSPGFFLGAPRSSVADGAGLEPGVPRRGHCTGLTKWISSILRIEASMRISSSKKFTPTVPARRGPLSHRYWSNVMSQNERGCIVAPVRARLIDGWQER
jgi:hypothetical protein